MPEQGSLADEVLERLVAKGRRTEAGPSATDESMDISQVYAGVTVSWLSQAFDMDPSTVKRRLADCPPLHRRKSGFTYELKRAAPFLVKPKVNVEEYLKTMKVEELPTRLQDQYWSAMNKRQKWEENAGELWRTDAVIEVLGAVFQTLKFNMQLWVDNLERETGLTDAQRSSIVVMVDALQEELHQKLVELCSEKSRRPVLFEQSEQQDQTELDDDLSELI